MSRWALLASSALLLVAPSAAGKEPAATTEKAVALELLGPGDKPRTLALRPERTNDPGRSTVLTGSMHLAVRNTGKQAAQLRTRYSAAGLDQLVTVPGSSSTIVAAPPPGSAKERLARLATGLTTSDPRKVVRVLRRLGGAPRAESRSRAARRLARAIRAAVAEDGSVSAAGAAGVASRLAPLLVAEGSAPPALAGADVRPVLESLGSPDDLATALGRYERAAAQRRYPEVPAGELGSVDLAFELPPGRTPADLSGTLVVEGFAGAEPTAQATVTATVEAAARPVTGAALEPKKAVVQVTRWCLFLCGESAEGDELLLVGAGSGDAVADLKRAGAQGASAILRTDGGQLVEAAIGPLSANADAPGSVSAPLRLTPSDPAAGKYTGELPLSRFASASPTLPVEVRSRVWFPLTFLLIFAGAFAAALLTHHVALRSRRALIRRYPQRTAAAYAEAASRNVVDGGEHLLEPLDIAFPLEDDEDWEYFADLKTARSVFTAAQWARSDADLDEAETAALRIGLQVTSWRLAFEQVRALHDLAQENHESIGTSGWREQPTAQQTRRLLARVRRDPPTGGPDDPVFAQIARQTRWHTKFAEAWDLWKEAERIAPGEAGRVKLPELGAQLTPLKDRTDDDQDALEDELGELVRELEEIISRDRMPAPARIVPRAYEIALLRTRVDTLQSGLSGRQLMLTEVAEPTAVPAPQERRRLPAMPRVGRANIMRRLRMRDTLLSLAIVAIASVIHALTEYGPTWGSVHDMAKAFLLGFGAQFAVKWALLPAYRSVRMTAKAADQAPEPTPAVAAIARGIAKA